MRTTIAAVTALAGSLLLAPLMLGPTQAGGAPDLKNALSATHPGAVTLVRGGGGGGGGHGGGFAMGGGHMGGGGWGGHMGGGGRGHGGGFAMGEGHMRGGHEFVGRGFGGARFAAHDFHHGFNHDHFRHFHNRRFFVSNVFIGGGYPYYYGDCYWLRRQAIITGSPYWWARYQACRGYY
jgi:hypothetical protein